MRKRSTLMISVLLFLAAGSVSYGIVLGDWEAGMDGSPYGHSAGLCEKAEFFFLTRMTHSYKLPEVIR